MFTYMYMYYVHTCLHGIHKHIHAVFAFNVLPNLPLAADFIISSDFNFP